MKWLLSVLIFALLAAPQSGCGKKALQTMDGSGGIDPIGPIGDGGVAGDAGPADVGGVADASADASWDLPVSGRRSFVVTSQVSAVDGTTTAHTFTLTLDTDRHLTVIGTSGSADTVPLEQTATGALRVAQVLAFGVPVQAACGGSVRYDDLAFTIEPSGILSGSGVGKLTTYPGTVGNTVAATMALTGIPDIEGPGLSLSASGDPADPWSSLWVVSSEPLPGDQMPPVLRSANGDIIPFGGTPGPKEVFAVLEKPRLLLQYGQQYRITFDGITDLAGNSAGWLGEATFTTRPPPPYVIPDGFESITDETLGGAQVLSGAGAPAINGTRSLYVPPAATLPGSGFVTQLALRLPILSAGRTLRFSYRFVNPGDTSGVYLVIASVGRAIETVSLVPNPGDQTTPATIGQDAVVLGPTTTAAIALPPDAHDEVVFARIASQSWPCGGPAPPPVPGIIIDDLRVP